MLGDVGISNGELVGLKMLYDFSDYIKITSTPDDFVSAIEKTLNGEVAPISDRIAIAKRYTYETRTRNMLKIVEKYCKS